MGIQVERGLITVAARILPPPALKYKDLKNKDMMVTPKFGSWNMANTRFHTASDIGSWTYLLLNSTGQGLPTQIMFIENVMKFKDFLNRAGMNADGFIKPLLPQLLA